MKRNQHVTTVSPPSEFEQIERAELDLAGLVLDAFGLREVYQKASPSALHGYLYGCGPERLLIDDLRAARLEKQTKAAKAEAEANALARMRRLSGMSA